MSTGEEWKGEDPLDIHRDEQIKAALRQFAAWVAYYYRCLGEDEGLSPSEAMTLACHYQTDMLNRKGS